MRLNKANAPGLDPTTHCSSIASCVLFGKVVVEVSGVGDELAMLRMLIVKGSTLHSAMKSWIHLVLYCVVSPEDKTAPAGMLSGWLKIKCSKQFSSMLS